MFLTTWLRGKSKSHVLFFHISLNPHLSLFSVSIESKEALGPQWKAFGQKGALFHDGFLYHPEGGLALFRGTYQDIDLTGWST